MIEHIQDYFSEELARLQALGYAIARQQGMVESSLSESEQWGNDPAVEQLLTGCAWLTARVKHQFDHYQLDWQEQMLRYLMPDTLRPFPAMSIAVWQDLQLRCGETVMIPAGTALANIQEGLTECERSWQTTQRISLHPVSVSKCDYQSEPEPGGLIEVELTLNPQVNVSKFHLTELVFYLNAPIHLAHRLYYLLLHPETKVLYQTDTQSRWFTGNPFVAYWCENDEQSVVFSSSDAQRLLQWYAIFPQQFLFVRMRQLEKVIWSARSRSLRFRIMLPDTCALGFRIGKETLLLNCCPIVNVWQRELEPVKLKKEKENYHLVFDVGSEAFYHVSQIIGYCRQQHLSISLTPFNYLQQTNQDAVYYRLLRRKKRDDGYRYEVALSGSQISQLNYMIITLLTCTCNTDHVIKISDKLAWESANGLSSLFQIKSLVLPSRWHPTITGSHIVQRLAQCLQRSGMSLDYFQREFSYIDSIINHDREKRKSVLKHIHLEPFYSLVKGVVHQGILLIADIDERDFDGRETLFFFGSIVYRFCQLIGLPGLSVRLRLKLMPSQEILSWGM